MKTPFKIVYCNIPRHRLRVRRLDPKQLAERVATKAKKEGAWQFEIFHGGKVIYHQPALTEAALVVANPLGETVVWMAKLPACKVTKGGAAEKCLAGTRALWDGRYNESTQATARKVLQEAHRVHFPQTVYERLMQDQF